MLTAVKIVFPIVLLGSLLACSGGDDSDSDSTPVPAAVTKPSSLGADGWASYYATGTGTTNGGANADSLHTYTVSNRNELLKALQPDVVIAADGSYTSVKGVDATPKIIYVKGTISLNTNAAGVELTEADYACPGYTLDAYIAAYSPNTWNKKALTGSTPKPPAPSGTVESARLCSSQAQAKVVKLAIGSNTSLLGLGNDAKIVHGALSIGDGTDNVVIRNITFEDAFDMFPKWDPTDSYNADANYNYVQPPAVADPTALYPKCQFAYDAATDNGPHQCPGGRWNSNYKNIGLSGGTHVWIDHCTFSDGDRETYTFPSVWSAPYIGHEYDIEHHDGLIDITLKSDFITLSYNRIAHHQKTHLIGSSDSVSANNGWGALSVTLHHNFYDNAGERMPRVRMGKVHFYNNYSIGVFTPSLSTPPNYGLSNPKDPDRPWVYGIGIGHLAKIYSENNVYDIGARSGDAAPDESAMYFLWHKADPTSGLAIGEHTYFYDAGTTLNGKAVDLLTHANAASAAKGKPVLVSTDTYWKPSSNYSYKLDPTSTLKASVIANAGAGKL